MEIQKTEKLSSVDIKTTNEKINLFLFWFEDLQTSWESNSIKSCFEFDVAVYNVLFLKRDDVVDVKWSLSADTTVLDLFKKRMGGETLRDRT